MASGLGESLKIWQKDYADQRCVLSYPCEKITYIWLIFNLWWGRPAAESSDLSSM